MEEWVIFRRKNPAGSVEFVLECGNKKVMTENLKECALYLRDKHWHDHRFVVVVVQDNDVPDREPLSKGDKRNLYEMLPDKVELK